MNAAPAVPGKPEPSLERIRDLRSTEAVRRDLAVVIGGRKNAVLRRIGQALRGPGIPDSLTHEANIAQVELRGEARNYLQAQDPKYNQLKAKVEKVQKFREEADSFYRLVDSTASAISSAQWQERGDLGSRSIGFSISSAVANEVAKARMQKVRQEMPRFKASMRAAGISTSDISAEKDRFDDSTDLAVDLMFSPILDIFSARTLHGLDRARESWDSLLSKVGDIKTAADRKCQAVEEEEVAYVDAFIERA